MYQDIFRALLKTNQSCIVVESKYTKHYIEKLMPTCKDRGRWKWIAESNCDEANPFVSDEFYRSNVDGADFFPRVYFHEQSLISELFTWFDVRKLEITNIIAPKR